MSSVDFPDSVDPFQPSVAFHIETSHLFCRAKRMTDFYMECNTELKWINAVFDNWHYH